MALKWKSKWDSTSLISAIEVLREEVELSNTRTAYVRHIPNTLISATEQTQAKVLIASSLVNFILIMPLQMLFFTAAILLCVVRDAQCKTSESP